MSRIDVTGKVAIVGAVRTPIGAVNGGLASVLADPLATRAVQALIEQSGIDPQLVEYTCFGWVMQDPRSTNLARNVALHAGIPWSSPATTLHENCASGAAAVHSIVRRIVLGEIEVGVAGGVESMSNVPRYLYAGRTRNQLYGDMTLVDGLMGALVDPEVGDKGEVMGLMTERLVERWGVSRELQDEIAYRSHANAVKAWEEGYFADYVVPVEVPRRKKAPVVVSRDEGPKKLDMEYFTKARPYFKPDGGTITAQNSSSINDAAAALLLMTQEKAKSLGLVPLATIHAFHNVGVERAYMGEGVFKVIPPLLQKAGLSLSEIDYFELNEAFAAVVGGAYKFLPDLDKERVNQWGSGISLGHPVGCTGARQIVDMVHQLRRRGARIGLTSRCVGGGIGSGEVLVTWEG